MRGIFLRLMKSLCENGGKTHEFKLKSEYWVGQGTGGMGKVS